MFWQWSLQMKNTGEGFIGEMFDACESIGGFDPAGFNRAVDSIKQTGRVLFAGNGWAGAFPAGNAIYTAMRAGYGFAVLSEGVRQAGEYDVSGWSVFLADLEGGDEDAAWLGERLGKIEHEHYYYVTCGGESAAAYKGGEILKVGAERQSGTALCAVVETAMVYQWALARAAGRDITGKLVNMAGAFERTLGLDVPTKISKALAGAKRILWTGRDDGVSEGLSVLTRKALGKESWFVRAEQFLSASQANLTTNDVVVAVNPFGAQIGALSELVERACGAGLVLLRDVDAETADMKVEFIGELQNYIYLAAGWNLIGSAAGY